MVSWCSLACAGQRLHAMLWPLKCPAADLHMPSLFCLAMPSPAERGPSWCAASVVVRLPDLGAG